MGSKSMPRLLLVCWLATAHGLQRPQVFRAVAISSVRLWTLSRAELARMEREAPALCILVQRALLKSMSLSDSDLISDLAVM